MLLVSNTVLMEFIVISASKECSLFSDDFKTPTLTIMMRDVLSDMLSTVDINSANSSVVMTNKNLTLHIVDGRGHGLMLERNLSQVFELTLGGRVHGHFEILTCRDQEALAGGNCCACAEMGFQDELELSFLVPAMDGSVFTTTVTDAILVESSAKKFGLGEFLPKSAILE